MAVAAGLVGCFAVMRRMTLASDAMSHIALPGIGLALAFHVHPILGGIAALFLGTLLIWALERETRVPTEAIIGVVFSAALAVGSMLASGEELIEALFGSHDAVSRPEALGSLVAAVAVVALVLRAKNRLVIALVSRDLGRTTGINVSALELQHLLTFALTVGLGLRYLGVLLMGSLIIIPAATAKHLARSLNAMLGTSVALAVVATVLGFYVAPLVHLERGALTIAISAGLFFVSLLRRREA